MKYNCTTYKLFLPKVNCHLQAYRERSWSRPQGNNQINLECGSKFIQHINNMFKNKQIKGKGDCSKITDLRDKAGKCYMDLLNHDLNKLIIELYLGAIFEYKRIFNFIKGKLLNFLSYDDGMITEENSTTF